MSFLGPNSKLYPNLEDLALKKISELITRFHSVLLPMTNDSGVYRDLSDEEEHLLNNLDSEAENSLHSILAGCLAIDSCLSNIFQSDRNLTENILKSLTLFLNSFAYTRPKEPQQTFTILVDNLIYMTQQVHQLPFAQSSSEYEKQLAVIPHLKKEEKLSKSIEFSESGQEHSLGGLRSHLKKSSISGMDIDQDSGSDHLRSSPTFKMLSSVKGKEQVPLQERALVISELSEENIRLKKLLKAYENKKTEKESLSLTDEIYYSQPNSQLNKDIFSLKKNLGNNPNIPTSGSYPLNAGFETPQKISQLYQSQVIKELKESLQLAEKEINTLKNQLGLYKRTNEVMKMQYLQEKKAYKSTIKKLQNQLWIVSGYEGVDLYELLNELEDQIDDLKQERRSNLRVLSQVQAKLAGLGYRRQRNTYDGPDYYNQYEGISPSKTRQSSRIIQRRGATGRSISRSRSRSHNSRVSIRRPQNSRKVQYDRPQKKPTNYDREDRYQNNGSRSQYNNYGSTPAYSTSPYRLKTHLNVQDQYNTDRDFRKEPYQTQRQSSNRMKASRGNLRSRSNFDDAEEPERISYIPKKRPDDGYEGNKSPRVLVLRASKTEQNLHQKMPRHHQNFIEIPVIQSIPYGGYPNIAQDNDSFMRTSNNDQHLQQQSMKSSSFGRKNGYTFGEGVQITKQVGFKRDNEDIPQQNNQQASRRRDRNSGVASSLQFDNPFQNDHDTDGGKFSGSHLYNGNQGGYQKQRLPTEIPYVEPLVFKNGGKTDQYTPRRMVAKSNHYY